MRGAAARWGTARHAGCVEFPPRLGRNPQRRRDVPCSSFSWYAAVVLWSCRSCTARGGKCPTRTRITFEDGCHGIVAHGPIPTAVVFASAYNERMDDNLYQSPRVVDDRRPANAPRCADPQSSASWHPLTWAGVGFGIGTVLIAPLVLSVHDAVQLQGGMLFGGIPGAIVGLAFSRPRPLGGS